MCACMPHEWRNVWMKPLMFSGRPCWRSMPGLLIALVTAVIPSAIRSTSHLFVTSTVTPNLWKRDPNHYSLPGTKMNHGRSDEMLDVRLWWYRASISSSCYHGNYRIKGLVFRQIRVCCNVDICNIVAYIEEWLDPWFLRYHRLHLKVCVIITCT